MKLTLIFYPQANGDYSVVCPEINRFSCGDTIEEATQNIKEMIADYFEHDKIMDIEDYIEAFNTGNKIFTEIEVNVK